MTKTQYSYKNMKLFQVILNTSTSKNILSVSLLSTISVPPSVVQTRGNALFLIIILGLGGSFQIGYHMTGLSSPSPVRNITNSCTTFSPGRGWESAWLVSRWVQSYKVSLKTVTAVHTELHQQQLVRQIWRASPCADDHDDLVPHCFHVCCRGTLWCCQRQIYLGHAGKVSKRDLMQHSVL